MGGPRPTRTCRPPASPAAPRPPRVESPARAQPASAYPLGSRQRGLCVSPLRGRCSKGDYVHGTGGGRLPGGRLATKLDGIGKSSAAKIDEFLSGGTIEKLEEYRSGALG